MPNSVMLHDLKPVLKPNSHGQPGDTPLARLSYLLNHLCSELDSPDANASDKAKVLAKQARELVDGYDPYTASMSSPHPPIIDRMVDAGDKRDWAALHREGKTLFELIPEMTAGTYEAVVLQQLAKLGKVRTRIDDPFKMVIADAPQRRYGQC